MQVHTVEGGGGLRLHVREWGNPRGMTILLIHGWSQNHLSWKHQFESDLADEFRLVTHGDQDTVVLPSMARHVLDVCPTAEVSWYEGIGHAPFLEDPERFNRELADFARRATA